MRNLPDDYVIDLTNLTPALRHDAVLPVEPAKTCAVCWQTFTRRDGERRAHYLSRQTCGRICRTALGQRSRGNDVQPKICVVCRRRFYRGEHEDRSNYRTRQTCSPDCKRVCLSAACRTQVTRPIEVRGHIAFVPLTQGAVAIIDAADVERIEQFTWSLNCSQTAVYASAALFRRCVRLHRFLLDLPPGRRVDHRNGNGLDCRRSNLRIATPKQNGANTRLSRRNRSGFKGVYLRQGRAKWVAQIKHDGRSKHIGTFETPEAAALAYDRAARLAYGEFACVNFPLPGERGAVG